MAPRNPKAKPKPRKRAKAPSRAKRSPKRTIAPTGVLGIAVEPQAAPIPLVVDTPEPHPPGHHFDLLVQDASGKWIEINPADIPPWRGDRSSLPRTPQMSMEHEQGQGEMGHAGGHH